jgi:hypothetical protein
MSHPRALPATAGEGRDQLEHGAEEQVEREDRCQRVEALAGVDEGDDPHGCEPDREGDSRSRPPTVRRRYGDELEQGAADAGDAEQDRDRVHARRIELEHNQREDEPDDTGQEETHQNSACRSSLTPAEAVAG